MSESKAPRLSMIVPVYNAAAYLTAGVTALLSQTFRDFELILVDDGSPDDSPALCDALAAGDARVRVIHQQNGGAGAARNTGIEAARGDYLMFPDADDECALNMAETLLRAAEECDADVVVCGYQSFDEAGDRERVSLPAGCYTDPESVRRFFTDHFPLGVIGYPWNKLFKKSLIDTHQLRFPIMRRYEDGIFLQDVFTNARRVCVLPDVLYRYRINSLTGLFQKYPPNNFELLRRLTGGYEQWLNEQDRWEPRVEQVLYPFFLNETVGSMDCIFSPSWKMDRAARRAYLARLAEDEAVQRATAATTEGLSRYAALVIRLLTQKRFGRLLFVMRVKLFLKRDCNRLFHRLKGALDR